MRRKVIMGLGNPGLEFKNTYHNVGVLALEEIAGEMRKNGAELRFKTHKGLFTYARTRELALVIPLTFMNESGLAAREAIKKFGISPEDLVVIHDESDLPLGVYRISAGKNSAGHKGVQSIMDALRVKDFTRVRIGIRKKNEAQRKKASEFILKEIKPQDGKILAAVFLKIARALFISSREP